MESHEAESRKNEEICPCCRIAAKAQNFLIREQLFIKIKYLQANMLDFELQSNKIVN